VLNAIGAKKSWGFFSKFYTDLMRIFMFQVWL